MGLCLFEIDDGHLRIEHVLQPDPLAAVLGGGSTEEKLKALRAAVDTEDYLIAKHDPDDWALRGAAVITFEDLVNETEFSTHLWK